jgi:trehalose/maltose transport system substrate-binding protein
MDRQANDRLRRIADLLRALKRGDLSRRELLASGAALGLGASVMARIAADPAFAQDATPEAIEPGATLRTPQGFDERLAGQRITVVLGADGPGTPWEEAVVRLFRDVTGIEVTLIPGAQSATERLANYLQVLNAQAPDFDALMIDVIWPHILAPHALDLGQALGDARVNFLEAIIENNTVDGALIGIPWYTDAGVLFYRSDLLEKYGVGGPPQTWADLETAARTIQDGERGTGSTEFWGFVWQGNAYEGLTCNALEWQVSNGGGNMIESDGTVTVNNPSVIAAFERAKGWIGTISPESVTTYQEEESRNVWQGGNAAFVRHWPYVHSTSNAAESVIRGKFAVTTLPRGDGEGARSAATLGGWQMMASRYSRNPDAAISFCRFLTSLEVQKSAAIERALLPTITALYDDPDVLSANPYYADLKALFLGGTVARPSTVARGRYFDVSSAYFTAVHDILTGASDAPSAIGNLEANLTEIMEAVQA